MKSASPLLETTVCRSGFAERIRGRFADLGLGGPDGLPLASTVSVGVRKFQPGDDANSRFCRADDGMYQAKRAGKNRVMVVAPPSGP